MKRYINKCLKCHKFVKVKFLKNDSEIISSEGSVNTLVKVEEEQSNYSEKTYASSQHKINIQKHEESAEITDTIIKGEKNSNLSLISIYSFIFMQTSDTFVNIICHYSSSNTKNTLNFY